MDDLTANFRALSCGHKFHRACIDQQFQYKPVCPVCNTIHGRITGNQPPGGSMHVSRSGASLPGCPGYGTITIQYSVPSGTQTTEHPNPGSPYGGTSRTAYLPDSPEGRQVESLLREAFDRRLIFTVGRSSTTGVDNQVIWNDIHHKTTTHGGQVNHGYPDPTYLSRVKEELAAKGVTS